MNRKKTFSHALRNTLSLIPSLFRTPRPRPESTCSRAVGDLIHRVSTLSRKTGYKTFAFLGYSQGQGVTSTIMRMVQSLSKYPLDGKILVIDANVVHPSLHSLLKVPQGPGLFEVLKKQSDFESAITSPAHSRVAFLSLGDYLSSGNGIFTYDSIHLFLQRCRERYEYILIDTPPFNLSPVALLLARLSDTVFIVLSSGEVHSRSAENCSKILVEHHCNLEGVILNRFRYSIPDYFYKIS